MDGLQFHQQSQRHANTELLAGRARQHGEIQSMFFANERGVHGIVLCVPWNDL